MVGGCVVVVTVGPCSGQPRPFRLADLSWCSITSQMESCLVWNRLCFWVRGWALRTRMCWPCFSILILNSVWFYASELGSSPVRRQAVHVELHMVLNLIHLNHQMREPSLLWWIFNVTWASLIEFCILSDAWTFLTETLFFRISLLSSSSEE